MRLAVERSGRGAPLVLWHGWGLNRRVFGPLCAALAADFELCSVDLPGHGASPWRAGADGAAQLAALLETLPPQATLLGWSLGGQFALQAALQAPERVARLVLLATTPRFTSAPDWPQGLAPATLAGFATRLHTDGAATVREFLELQVRGGSGSAAALAGLQAALAAHGAAEPAALAAGLELLATTDLRRALGRVRSPALVLCGERDRITPPAAGRALAAALPQARLLSLPRAAHAPFLSDTATVAAAVRDFVRAAPAPAGAA